MRGSSGASTAKHCDGNPIRSNGPGATSRSEQVSPPTSHLCGHCIPAPGQKDSRDVAYARLLGAQAGKQKYSSMPERASATAQIKAPATKTEGPSSTSGNCIWEGENQLRQVGL